MLEKGGPEALVSMLLLVAQSEDRPRDGYYGKALLFLLIGCMCSLLLSNVHVITVCTMEIRSS